MVPAFAVLEALVVEVHGPRVVLAKRAAVHEEGPHRHRRVLEGPVIRRLHVDARVRAVELQYQLRLAFCRQKYPSALFLRQVRSRGLALAFLHVGIGNIIKIAQRLTNGRIGVVKVIVQLAQLFGV